MCFKVPIFFFIILCY
uniref:Uncharacterized protein n=1 Tax=Rhizophora mucronata TaxID=61149 RepID=A0A2P2NKX1_RHIMU